MSQHIEEIAEEGGITKLRIWYDDPENEDPMFGEDGEQIMHEGHGRDAWLAQMYHHLGKLKMQARAKLGAGKVYEIRAKIPTNFGMNVGVAWYTTKAMQALELVDEKPYPGVHNELGGYMFMGRMKT
jgi:hypothetical protein